MVSDARTTRFIHNKPTRRQHVEQKHRFPRPNMQDKMTRPKRLHASDLGSRNWDLPNGFEFLKGFRFHSIVEYAVADRLQRRIEVLPTTLRRTIERASKVDQLEQKYAMLERELIQQGKKHKKILKRHNKELKDAHAAAMAFVGAEKLQLEAEVAQLKSAHRELAELCQQLEKNNAQLLANKIHPMQEQPEQRSQKTFFNVVDEGAKFQGLPISGGLPSLGKHSR